MTTAEYLLTAESLVPTELIYGRLRVADAPMPRHQRAVRDLCLALVDPRAESRRLGEVWISPVDVILDAESALIVQPDLFFISNERSHILSDRVRGAPDLVVEVLSPNPRIGKLGERIGWFQEYGVKECWLIHQLERRTRGVELHRHESDRSRVVRRQDARSIAGIARFRSHSRVDTALGLARIHTPYAWPWASL